MLKFLRLFIIWLNLSVLYTLYPLLILSFIKFVSSDLFISLNFTSLKISFLKVSVEPDTYLIYLFSWDGNLSTNESCSSKLKYTEYLPTILASVYLKAFTKSTK